MVDNDEQIRRDVKRERERYEMDRGAFPHLYPYTTPRKTQTMNASRESFQIWADSLILPPRPAGPSLEDAERWAIIRAVKEHRGNLRAAARTLQIGKTTLYRKVHNYNLGRGADGQLRRGPCTGASIQPMRNMGPTELPKNKSWSCCTEAASLVVAARAHLQNQNPD